MTAQIIKVGEKYDIMFNNELVQEVEIKSIYKEGGEVYVKWLWGETPVRDKKEEFAHRLKRAEDIKNREELQETTI
jgi:hypothetical protein